MCLNKSGFSESMQNIPCRIISIPMTSSWSRKGTRVCFCNLQYSQHALASKANCDNESNDINMMRTRMKIYVKLLSMDTVAQLEKKVFSQASGLFKSLFRSRCNESAASQDNSQQDAVAVDEISQRTHQ